MGGPKTKKKTKKQKEKINNVFVLSQKSSPSFPPEIEKTELDPFVYPNTSGGEILQSQVPNVDNTEFLASLDLLPSLSDKNNSTQI